MVGGTIELIALPKLIHRESFRASVLHPSENQAVLKGIATENCLLTTPSLLSSGTRQLAAQGSSAWGTESDRYLWPARQTEPEQPSLLYGDCFCTQLGRS